LIYRADGTEVEKWIESIRAGQRLQDLDFRIFYKSGELRHMHVKGALVFDQGAPIRFTGTMQDITERKLAEIQIQQQLEHLNALRRIDQAITSSFNMHATLDVVITQVVKQLQVDVTDILLLTQDGNSLRYAAGSGFRSSDIKSTLVHLNKSYAGQAIKSRQIVQIENIHARPNNPLLQGLLAGEDFASYYCVPLIVKGKVLGVLEVFHRSPKQSYPEWIAFLETLAGQAAIAIDNTTLFENLEQANAELTQAYNATIEGWSRAMDLRDTVTEGHSQRVTELTLQLAKTMGVDITALEHIRRGALLHDMGKLGVPDHILHKPGKLTEEEWEIMRKHPAFVHEILYPIAYLRPALDIPHCHHEKWDGSGYPRGLKGDQIPLSARIFTVVDAWDALTNDRPYRKAWTKEKTIKHIKDESGKQFDPQVVDAFLNMIDQYDSFVK
jgi:HD-GYP domain-containing protein (c-di-GMP phosphodiesterase class II)